MNGFQLVGLLFVAMAAALCLRAYARSRAGRKVTLVWLAIWAAAGIAIARPGTTAWVAEFLGIGRGADLVLYCSVLAMGAGFFLVYSRLRQIESSLTRIVRDAAIRDGVAADRIRSGDAREGP